MDRTFIGDLQKPPALLRIERAGQCDGALDAVDHPFLGLAILAIGGVDAPMAKLDRHPLERQRLALGIESKRHGGAGSEPREHQVVGTRTAVEAADVDRLVGQEAMRANRDRLLEAALTGFANDDRVGIVRRLRGELRHVEIALGPGVNDVGDVGRVAAAAQQVIGAGERDEAFGMLGRGEDAARIVDADDLVGRRVEDQQCLAQIGNAIDELVLGEIVDEAAADAKLPTRQRRFDLALGADFVETVLEQAGHVGGIAGRGDRHHRARLRHFGGGGEHRRAAEAVADEDGGRTGAAAQLVGGRDQIGDVGGKGGVGEFALARTEAGEVEAQHGDAERGQAFGDALGGPDVLAAGKAVRKQRVGARLLVGAVEQRGKLLSVGVRKIEALSRHALLPSTAGGRDPRDLNQSRQFCD